MGMFRLFAFSFLYFRMARNAGVLGELIIYTKVVYILCNRSKGMGPRGCFVRLLSFLFFSFRMVMKCGGSS